MYKRQIIEWAKQDQPASKPPTKAALVKAMAAGDSMDDAERALLAVTRDQELRDQLRPRIGVIRRDLRGRPVVIHAGGLVVVETPSRKNAGAHYTPRDLAEEVVQHALDPLVYHPGPHQTDDRSAWRLRSSDELLDLKVADIACGSGAFLVAAARFLSARLVEAWRAEGSALGTPHDQEVRAIREVVAQCLYGADINAMAVEMCKLSLWLVTLAPMLGVFAFAYDGIFIGATWAREMRNLMVLSLGIFLGAWLALRSLGNAGLWGALLVHYAARGGVQALRYPAMLKRAFGS